MATNKYEIVKYHILYMSIFGFQISASLASIFDVNTAIYLRASIFLLSIYSIFTSIINNKFLWTRLSFFLLATLLMVILAYSIRIGYESWVTHSTSNNPFRYFSFLIIAGLVPSFAMALGEPLKSFNACIKIGAIYSFFAMILIGIALYGEYGTLFVFRKSFEELNSILVAHAALTSVLIGCACLFMRKSVLKKNIILVLIIISLFLFYTAGSRGGLLSLFVIGMFVIISAFRFSKNGFFAKKNILVVISLLVIFIIGLVAIGDDHVLDNEFIERAKETGTNTDRSGDKRTEMWVRGLDIFLMNPLIGGGFEDTVYYIYPHNIAIESLMSMGLIGSIPYFTCILFSCVIAFKRSSRFDVYILLNLIYIQYLVASSLSGAIWNSNIVMMFIFLYFSQTVEKINRDIP